MNDEKKLKEIICNIAKNEMCINDINDETLLIDDLGFDSVQIVSLIIEIESTFDVMIDDANLDIKTLSQYALLRNMVERTVNNANFK